jgi:hypothetical protein
MDERPRLLQRGEAARQVATCLGQRWPRRSFALGSMRHDGLGSFVKNGAGDTGNLTRGPTAAGMAPRWLAAAVVLL